ncbi:diaminopropionate ammonia-lyase [Caballeronia calidae]|uniref:Diaminopropionate ammonia-lyase n=1 Tax=Caballeronia calidae TaxID=1777139 RepID=A0A158DQ03_9BURK|nr:diaminopropionate ammonia-lyase [Caballeronia calidae]
MLIDDSDAIDAMKTLAQGVGHDVPIVAGESGAAGFAGLVVSMRDRELARSIGLDAKARVLVINTEGATAPGVYARLVGASAEEVSARQREWLKRAAG